MFKNEASIFVTPFCIVHLHDSKLNPAKHGLEKTDCMNHCQVHQYNMRSKKDATIWLQKLSPKRPWWRCSGLLASTKHMAKQWHWFFPIQWLKWIRCPATIQTHQANCMEREQYLFWWCFAIHLKKYGASNLVSSPMFGQKITKIFFETTIWRYSNGCMYPNPFMKFNFNVIHAVLPYS